MSRPLYESPEDLALELGVAQTVAAAWRVDIEKMHIKYRLDFLMLRDGVAKAWMEIRVRKTQYKTMALSLDKWYSMQSTRQGSRLPVFLVVKWSNLDGLFYLEITESTKMHIEMMTPARLRDKEDREPVVHIPVSLFKQIGE